MIKFFRNIRQKLLSEGKSGRYLKYAFGEILLVVLGILIALQINNWNNKRIEHKKEEIYLVRLKKELSRDTSFLDFQFNIFNNAIKSIKLAIQQSYVTQNNKDDIDSLLSFQNFVAEVLTIHKTTYDDLVNTQNLNVIQNDSLRFLIVEYYRSADHAARSIHNFNQTAWDLQTEWMTVSPLAKYYPWNVGLFSEEQLYYQKDFSFINDPTSYEFKLMETMQLFFLNKNQVLMHYYVELKEAATKIMYLIEEELD